MRRAYRLRDSEDFRRVRRLGRSWAHPLMVLFAAPNGEDRIRVGVSVSKRVGGAVVRNRAKRRIRENVRVRLDSLIPGSDLLFIVRPAAAQATSEEVSVAVVRVLALAGLVATEPCSASPRG